jgi:hypothetical protein
VEPINGHSGPNVGLLPIWRNKNKFDEWKLFRSRASPSSNQRKVVQTSGENLANYVTNNGGAVYKTIGLPENDRREPMKKTNHSSCNNSYRTYRIFFAFYKTKPLDLHDLQISILTTKDGKISGKRIWKYVMDEYFVSAKLRPFRL